MDEIPEMMRRMTEHMARAVRLTGQWAIPPEQIPPRALGVINDLTSGLHAGLTFMIAEMSEAARRGDIDKTLELTNRVHNGLMQFAICAYSIGHAEGEPAPEWLVSDGHTHTSDNPLLCMCEECEGWRNEEPELRGGDLYQTDGLGE